MAEEATKLFQNPLLRSYVIERRGYQLDIAREALRRNTLVVLPTALGKTMIAILTVAHFLYNHRDKKVLVMAPTRPLVLQHWETFMSFLKLRPEQVEVLTGKNPPSYRMHAWGGGARLFFATPQVVANDYERGIRLGDFCLLVFDECHRARKNYAYTKVAEAYVRNSPYPMILAMTASPGASRERIEELCRALFIEHIEIRTEDDPDVSPYVSPIGVERVYVELPERYGEIRAVLNRMLERRLKALVDAGLIKKSPKFIFRNDLLELGERLRRELARGRRGEVFGAILLQSSALTLYHALELLESQGFYTFQRFIRKLAESKKRSHRSVVSELKKEGALEKILEEGVDDHPKLGVVERVVSEQFSKNPGSRIMVFTQYRDTSQRISQRLSELGFATERFVGQAKKGAEGGMTQEQQAQILRSFREGSIRVLVATSIGEEGLDIPSVDLVVFYEPVPSEIRYIQRKGRTGRRRFGRVVILATTKTLDVSYLWSSRRKVERMKRVIKRLNTSLSPILRLGNPPELNPIPLKEIVDVEIPEIPAAVELEELERLKLKRFNREVTQAAKLILSQVLRRGVEGCTEEEISGELEGRGLPPAAVAEALSRLRSTGEISEVLGRFVPAGVGVVKQPGLRTHLFEVEKVLAGRAVLIVDGKWRSVLVPQEYTGPRDLIKRGTRFQAMAELYRYEGKLHARIHAVERVLS